MIFGITGGSGAGKSGVSQILRKNGIYVADADKAARAVMSPGSECLNQLSRELGECILNEDGSLNRAKTADIVFSDDKKLEILNKISHKYINEYVLEEIKASKAELAAIDGAVIIGSPVESSCEFIVLVTAPECVRLKRIMERDKIDAAAAKSRIAAQPPEEFYRKHSEYVIENNGTAAELELRVEWLIGKIKGYSE